MENIKSLKQVQAEAETIFDGAEVYDTAHFASLAERKCFISFDGDGFYHDGVNETDISVWDSKEMLMSPETPKKYPYVVWYSK